MFADATAQGILNHITGRAALFASGSGYVALFTTMPTTEGGAGAVEASGNAYARVTTLSGDWNAATGSGPASINNANPINFPTATGGGWGTVQGFGLYDAAAAGTLRAFDWLGNFSWLPYTNASGASGIVTSKAHGFSNGDSIVFTNFFGGTAATFTTGSTAGVCTASGVTTDTFFALSSGGIAINFASTGDGSVRKISQQSVPGGVQPSFAAGNLTLTAA